MERSVAVTWASFLFLFTNTTQGLNLFVSPLQFCEPRKCELRFRFQLLAGPKTIDVNTQDLLVCEKHNRGIMRAKVHSRHDSCKSTFEAWLVQKYNRGMTRAKTIVTLNFTEPTCPEVANYLRKFWQISIETSLFDWNSNQQRQNCFWKTQEP